MYIRQLFLIQINGISLLFHTPWEGLGLSCDYRLINHICKIRLTHECRKLFNIKSRDIVGEIVKNENARAKTGGGACLGLKLADLYTLFRVKVS